MNEKTPPIENPTIQLKEEKTQDKPQDTRRKTIKLKQKSDTTISYKTIKASIKKIRLELRNKPTSVDSLSKAFEEAIVDKIIPYWYGTKWSFEGHTATPKQGEIACGYFVSTTLKAAGLKINRYQLAQQNPLNEAKTVALNKEILVIQNNTKPENIRALNQLTAGLYFIGFDQSHVGYLLKRDNQLYLIHSTYISSEGVIVEHIEESDVFASYDKFYIAELSTNETLLKNWINGTEIKVIKE